MGWDDSDDEIDIDAKLAANTTKDAYADEAKLLAAPKAEVKASKVKAAAAASDNKTLVKEWDEDEVELADPAAEKARKQRLEMRGDLAAADDLFGGFVKVSAASEGSRVREITKVIEKDSFAELQLKTSKDVEAFAQKVVVKLKACRTKGAPFQFIKDILRAVDAQLEAADCLSLAKTLTDLEKVKKRAIAEKMQNKTKGAGNVDSMKLGAKVDIGAEMGDVYGEGESDSDY